LILKFKVCCDIYKLCCSFFFFYFILFMASFCKTNKNWGVKRCFNFLLKLTHPIPVMEAITTTVFYLPIPRQKLFLIPMHHHFPSMMQATSSLCTLQNWHLRPTNNISVPIYTASQILTITFLQTFAAYVNHEPPRTTTPLTKCCDNGRCRRHHAPSVMHRFTTSCGRPPTMIPYAYITPLLTPNVVMTPHLAPPKYQQ